MISNNATGIIVLTIGAITILGICGLFTFGPQLAREHQSSGCFSFTGIPQLAEAYVLGTIKMTNITVIYHNSTGIIETCYNK